MVICTVFLLVCVYRLAQIQIVEDSLYREKVKELKVRGGFHHQLKTLRGRILDRNAKVLATDEPQFQLHLDYGLSRFMDEHVIRAMSVKASAGNNSQLLQQQIDERLEELKLIIDKCEQFGLQGSQIKASIEAFNERIWNLRVFLAWARNKPNPDILKKYDSITFVPAKVAIADFEQRFADENERFRLIDKVKLADIDQSMQLLELKTDDDIFTAQLEFSGIEGIGILPGTKRVYKYDSVAAQTIGWVGPAQSEDQKLFENDQLSRYLSGELGGREDGTEFVCEAILRGKRGEVIYDIDQRLYSHKETQFGRDVRLTIDIELQKKIQQYLTNCNYNDYCNAPTSMVVIDVASGEIIATVSLPVFNLNRVRYDYAQLSADPNKPLLNRALNEYYPPGSAIKPLILIAALESAKITADEVISCPAHRAPKGWPNCWLFKRYRIGHDDKWANIARNAIKGSCNIYFSQLADRIPPAVLQRWLYDFGFAKKVPLAPSEVTIAKYPRDFRQLAGVISSGAVKGRFERFEDIPTLKAGDRRWFGIGQGDLRVTPLQAANMMATIARGGLYRKPTLFIDKQQTPSESVSLDISPQTLDIVLEGMRAVINERDGTAELAFSLTDFISQGVKVYGKTGSTEGSYNAWFAGFAEDHKGRSIAVAVVVEGGQHGSSDAAPLAREAIQFCIEAGYLGQK